MLANFAHVHNGIFDLFHTCPDADHDPGAEEEETSPYFIIPDTLRLSMAQRIQLTESGFNQGHAFMLSEEGMTRPEVKSSSKIHSLQSLCTIHAESMKIVSVPNSVDLPPPSEALSKVQIASIILAREQGAPEFELQFDYTADCDALLTCYFGAFVKKDLNQIKIRSDLPGSKKWDSIRLSAGSRMRFQGSNFGLTFVQHDPIFYRLQRLSVKGGTAKEILVESIRSGIYDAILTLSPTVECADMPSAGRVPTGVDAESAIGGSIEMSSSKITHKNDPGYIQKTKWQRAKAAMMGRAPSALRDTLNGNVACSAEFTLCQLVELPEFRQISIGFTNAVLADATDYDLPSKGASEKYVVSAASLSSENLGAVEERGGEITTAAIMQDLRKVIPMPAIESSSVLLTNASLTNVKVFDSATGQKPYFFRSMLHVTSQRMQWNNEFYHAHEIYGADWSTFGLKPQENTSQESKSSQSDSSDNGECVICLGARKEIICIPCCHMCICADCAKIMKNQQTAAILQNRDNPRVLLAEVFKCPMCRSRVSFLVHTVAPAQSCSI